MHGPNNCKTVYNFPIELQLCTVMGHVAQDNLMNATNQMLDRALNMCSDPGVLMLSQFLNKTLKK